MPTAYDLSSVITGGTSVSHNNLIPLGESYHGVGGWGKWTYCSWEGGAAVSLQCPVALAERSNVTRCCCQYCNGAQATGNIPGLWPLAAHHGIAVLAAGGPRYSLSPQLRLLNPVPFSWPSTANTGIVNHTHSRMGSIMSTGIVQGELPSAHSSAAGAACGPGHCPGEGASG